MNTVGLEFYINKFCIIDDVNSIDLSFVPMLLRRKLSTSNRLTVSALQQCFDEKTQEIVFSSQFGEMDRLLQLISQYNESDEVSPITFSSSVHNFIAGFFTALVKKSIPYQAISATENSLSMGLLTSVASKFENILFCYCDCQDAQKCVAMNISKKPVSGAKKIYLNKNDIKNLSDNFEEFVEFLSGTKTKIQLANYVLEYAND